MVSVPSNEIPLEEQDSSDSIVKIKNGQIKGCKGVTKGNETPYKAYQGIPYAEPPIGKLRFEPPVPKTNWDGILDVTKQGNACIQIGDIKDCSEDCLFLNVFVPELPETSSNDLLPVVVWIHGGGYLVGSAHDPPDYLIEKGIIFVSLNYRLGIFGFFSTGDVVAPGNAGLKDQLLALKWVQDNIDVFGGNPKDVTLFGQSAGSMSAAYHIISPSSAGLFQRAIMNSGVCLCPSAFSRVASDAAKAVGKALSIDYSDSQSLVEELKKVNAEDLHKASLSVMKDLLIKNPKDGFVFAPVQEPEHDGAFFSGKAHQLLVDGDFNKVPILLGYNSLEGAFDFTGIFKLFLLKFDCCPKLMVPADMNIANERIKKKVSKKIRDQYFGCKYCCCCFPVFCSKSSSAMQWITDDQFVRPIREFARLTSRSAPTYLYEFAHKGLLGDPKKHFDSPTHAEELNYLFPNDKEGTKLDYLIRERMTTLWTNFAKFQNPTPEKCELLQNIIWPYVGENLPYLHIGGDLKILNDPKSENMTFWDNLYDKYGIPPYDTY